MENKTYARMLELKDEIIANRRYLHQCPELSFDLPKTTAYVMEQLRAYGYEPRKIGKAGVTCTAGSGGKTILLRGDMDALPMAEETGLPFASTNGCMHACGHDFHTTALLAAAKVLKEREDELCGMEPDFPKSCAPESRRVRLPSQPLCRRPFPRINTKKFTKI